MLTTSSRMVQISNVAGHQRRVTKSINVKCAQTRDGCPIEVLKILGQTIDASCKRHLLWTTSLQRSQHACPPPHNQHVNFLLIHHMMSHNTLSCDPQQGPDDDLVHASTEGSCQASFWTAQLQCDRSSSMQPFGCNIRSAQGCVYAGVPSPVLKAVAIQAHYYHCCALLCAAAYCCVLLCTTVYCCTLLPVAHNSSNVVSTPA